MMASKMGITAAVGAIVAADPAPDHIRMTDPSNVTALMYAASTGKPRIVELLIKADPSGDHLNMKMSYGTALAIAIQVDGHGQAGAAECVALLRAAGAMEPANALIHSIYYKMIECSKSMATGPVARCTYNFGRGI